MTSSPWSQSPVPCYASQNSQDYLHYHRYFQTQGHYFPNMPGIPMNYPLPPGALPPPPPQMGLSGNILSSPLPTALFPLPLDPLFPPSVLPVFPNGTSQSSGYSTAGHSRSSSPMMGPSTSTGQTHLGILGNSPTDSNGQATYPTSRNGSPSSPLPGSSSGSASNHAHHTQQQLPVPFPSPNMVFEAPSTEITILSHFPTVPGQYVVYFHINPGVNVNFSVGDHYQIIKEEIMLQRHNMLSAMVSSTGGSPGPLHDYEILYNTSSPPQGTMLSCDFHHQTPYGPLPPSDCTYYATPPPPHAHHEAYGYTMGHHDLHHQILNTEYGPMTVPLVATSSNPPMPLPMQVPPGHVVQQIVDESGTLRHVIVSHQPPLMPIPSYGPGNQNQPYFSPGPGYPSFGPMQGACGMHSNQGGPTPPPGSNVMSGSYGNPPHASHKDDRAQRQYVKLRRKFEQKQQRDTPTFPNHYQNGTYRKDGGYNNNNNSRRNVPNGTSKTLPNGEEDGSVGSTGSVTSTGTQDEEDEHRLVAQSEMLSAIVSPIVSDVTCRSAFIKWSIPERWTESGENKYLEFDISDNDFRYEVFINDQSRPENRFKSIFLGTALSCRVKDLKPGTNYGISYCAMLNDVKGNTSTPALFTTLPAEPEAPLSPRAMTRNRNSLTFKWNSPNDNGSKITAYLLEYDEGKGGSHFVEAYKGKNKQATVSKLQPAYSYQFRLAAINDIGQSRFSPTTTVMTNGNPPAQPQPPTLTEAGVTYLTLEWKRRPTDDEYSLQMEDPATGHGYLGAYSGNAPHCTCIGLRRYTDYKFRVKAYNAEGHSKWSDEVVLRTLPDRPQPPYKPTLKGRTHSSSFRVRWEPPEEQGGVPITAYSLEIDQANGHFEEIYRGPETEFLVDKLSPGQSYPLRVIAIGPGGDSDPSDPCVITTEPVCPGKCHIPRIVGKPKSNSVHLKWSSPEWDGGSPVNSFEVGCTTSDNLTQEAYRGKETSCFVNGLLPGRSYLFQIRAYNRIGAGVWSDPLEVISGAGSPDAPCPPKVTNKSSHSVLVSWAEPLNNGSAVTEYRVQMAALVPQLPPSPVSPLPSSPFDLIGASGDPPVVESSEESLLKSNEGDGDADLLVSPGETTMTEEEKLSTNPDAEQEFVSTFSQVYLGPNTSCEVKALQPASVYLFRLQASNCAGCSEWSIVTTHTMSASSPNAVTQVEGVASSSSIAMTWAVPPSNGSPILHYNLMIGESLLIAETNSHVLDNLMPDTHHKIRVQAVNSVGPGSFSTILKISTKPLPPVPPKLELVATAHFWMKLKWNPDPAQKNVEYIVQMINPFQDEFQVVYRGIFPNCKVARLTEDTEYQFRICGLNAAGQGHFSDMFRFSTLKAPPTQVKGLKVNVGKNVQLHHFEWLEVSSSGTVIYQLQLAKKKDQEFKTLFRGEGRKFDLKIEDLDRGVDYLCRVCAIRQVDDGNHLVGPYSSLLNFSNPFPLSESYPVSKSHTSSSFTSNFSTTAQVLEEKMNSISYESKVGLMAVIALVFLAFIISLITHHVVS